MIFTFVPLGGALTDSLVAKPGVNKKKWRLKISHLNPRSEELYSGNDMAKNSLCIAFGTDPQVHPMVSVCWQKVLLSVHSPRAHTSRILFPKVFSEANQVERYRCWNITELSSS